MSKVIDMQGALVDAPVSDEWPKTFIDVKGSGKPRTVHLSPPLGTHLVEFNFSGRNHTPLWQAQGGSYSWVANKMKDNGTATYIDRQNSSQYHTVFFDDVSVHSGTWSLTGFLHKWGNGWVGLVEGFWNGAGGDWGDHGGDYYTINGRINVTHGYLDFLGGYDSEASGNFSMRAVAFR